MLIQPRTSKAQTPGQTLWPSKQVQLAARLRKVGSGRGVTAADVAAVPSPYIQLPVECDPLILVCSDEQGTVRPLLCKVAANPKP